MKREKRLYLRYSEEEIEYLKQCAHEANSYVNDFVINLASGIDITIEKPSKFDIAALKLLKHASGNFNQIAKVLNYSVKFMEPVNPHKLEEWLNNLRDELKKINDLLAE
ncbi:MULTISPECIES: hypothetical protein [unclassified Oleiphilus]|uniref:plasmid mobilization protein n=1 Tax=unclassified Oleiphilus TaxID=2631174 RepID=UPI0007C3138B|nr:MULTISPECIES: hypothetical protein [unclassified Oleiphilus]KZY36363.1 hypothetical protein A3729_17235 [Oleiphilus sp. HI0043]KZZ66844.1 hypothetical protein A3763_16860 [Oleiphilus sp. HI0128]